MLHRNRDVVKAQRSCRGKSAMVVVDTLPTKIKAKVRELYPNAGEMKLQEWFKDNYNLDSEARAFFSQYRFPDGSSLKPEKINEYTINASVILAVKRLMASASALRKATGDGKVRWEEMTSAVSYFKKEFGHTLPESAMRFRKAVASLDNYGFESLISKRHKNQNSRKVNYKVERLILSLDSLPQRPFNTTVHEMYMSFVCGELDVYDPETGEMFDPDVFTDKKGEPLELSEATIANYLNTPMNRALRAKLHSTAWDFNNEYRPHHNRKAPAFAFSKVSLDDRDLPRKMMDGNRVKAYYAYDVASGCVVGYAYSRLKTADLFVNCVRNMFQTIERNGWNCPAQVEVEHHLVSDFSGGLMKAGIVFPFVRWCNPGNSQEKRAEHFNRSKKYGAEKLNQVGIGRWYSKLEANRPKIEKVYDEKNNTYREKEFTYEELVADDICAIQVYNNQPHPNQRLYTGLSRWQVLCQNQNPDLQPVDKAILYRFIGEKRITSIRRNMYCMVSGTKFMLPSPEYIEKLAPHDYGVEAYFLPDEGGNVPEVHIYQNDNYIASCAPVELYNEAAVEQTDADIEAYRKQASYVAQFDAMMKHEKIQKVEVAGRVDYAQEEMVVETVALDDNSPTIAPEFRSDVNYAAKGLEDL